MWKGGNKYRKMILWKLVSLANEYLFENRHGNPLMF